MGDTYQAVYDAVRSKISGGDVGAAIREVAWQAFDISHAKEWVKDELICAAREMQRPSVLYRPAICIDGNMWCALYGDNLQDGVAGFGDSPAGAMADFDAAWGAKFSDRAQPPSADTSKVEG
jgi:hypothetical protein